MDGSQDVRPGKGTDPGHTPDRGLDWLLRNFDPLLSDPQATLTDFQKSSLLGLAMVFDLDAAPDADPADIWRRLRPVMVKQTHIPAGERPGSEHRALTLLVVEDDPALALELVESLGDAGHGVVGPVASAEAAAVAAGLYPLDAALIDINLEGEQTGVDLARQLMTKWGVPTLFLSGDFAEATRNADYAIGVVFKPYRITDVLVALDKAVTDGLIPD